MARGKRATVHTSKATGFGPRSILRYVLPYTAHLELKQQRRNAAAIHH
jgi:hypothetical protein